MMLRLLLLILFMPVLGSAANLESPQGNTVESGVGLIRGWACEANRIEIRLDDGPLKRAAYGTDRGDTEAACGDRNNGFGVTQNWGLLGNGAHNIKAYADGVLFADVDFSVAALDDSFLKDAFAESVTYDFPDNGRFAILRWSEPDQNMKISGTGTSRPSDGSGGNFPGETTRTVFVNGLGNQAYYLYIPPRYDSARPSPLLFAFHGAAGPGTADRGAQTARNTWETVADLANLIVVAQVATGSNGGWVPGNATAVLSEILEDVKASYNVESSRIYLWGFSAGGHYAHALALQNTDLFAGYGVSAGVLSALAGSYAPNYASTTIPLAISIGTSDPLYPYALQDVQTFSDAGWTSGHDLFLLEFAGGHNYSASQVMDIWTRIGTKTLP